jgi:triacylglycerol lipase
MAADPIVAQDVLNALDPRHPAPVPCTAVLPLIGAPLYSGPPR